MGTLHVASAVAALLLGAVVLLGRKGDPRHRAFGYSYIAAMLTMNVTALAIYRLSGHFGAFHFAALFSLATLVAGWTTVRLKRRSWRVRHAIIMSASYVGLLAAAASEAVVRLPIIDRHNGFQFAMAVSLASAVVLIAGFGVICRQFGPEVQAGRR